MSYESWAWNFAVKDPPSPLLATPQLPRQQTHESGWHITITFHRQVNMIFHLQELLVVFPRTKLLVDYLKQSLDITSPSPVACLYPYKWFWFSLLCTVINRVKVVNSWYVYSRTVFKIIQNLLELHGAKEERLSFFSALPCLPPTSCGRQNREQWLGQFKRELHGGRLLQMIFIKTLKSDI